MPTDGPEVGGGFTTYDDVEPAVLRMNRWWRAHSSEETFPTAPNRVRLFRLVQSATREDVDVLGILVLFLVVWLVMVVLGIAIKGLFWLVIIGAILFVATGVIGFVKREALGRKH